MPAFTISGHQFKCADNPNRVALYIGGDVYGNDGATFSRAGIARECAALDIGETVGFRPIPWAGPCTSALVQVTRNA